MWQFERCHVRRSSIFSFIVAVFFAATINAQPRIEPSGPVQIVKPTRATQASPLMASLARPASERAWNRYAYTQPTWFYYYGCGYGFRHGCYGYYGYHPVISGWGWW